MSTNTTPNLGVVITNAAARKAIYGTYVAALVAVGATQVGFAAVQAGQPAWLVATVAVIGYLGIPIGGLALVNAPTKTTSTNTDVS